MPDRQVFDQDNDDADERPRQYRERGDVPEERQSHDPIEVTVPDDDGTEEPPDRRQWDDDEDADPESEGGEGD
jgi:hypothetical protein